MSRKRFEAPSDVAVLDSWADLHGAKYRDFSASRKEYRAQIRYRAAEQMKVDAAVNALEAAQLASPPQGELITDTAAAANTVDAASVDASIDASGPIADTLQLSRERVASRWFALKGIFDGTAEQIDVPPARTKEQRAPWVALFSMAGGVGKTSMVAALGRALASLGERTLLVDTTACGLLPFYFGARELRPGTMRTFSPPNGSANTPINLLSINMESATGHSSEEGASQDWLVDEISRHARGISRVVIDIATASGVQTRRILRMGPVVLVPVSPDLNSVISLANVEKFFQNQVDTNGRAVKVFYLLNQFDAGQPLHLDVREVLSQQLGERLLPFSVRRSPVVSEALAEGMTVMDYAPNSPVADDYMNLSAWIRSTSAPAIPGFRGLRWSEM